VDANSRSAQSGIRGQKLSPASECADIFEIASRYHDMLRSFPVNEWISRLNPTDDMPASTPELTAGVLRYLATVHFAFVLHELRYLSKDLWRLLQAEHHRTLATALFIREWNMLRHEFNFFPSFLTYVDSIQRGPTWIGRNRVTLRGNAASAAWRSFGKRPLRPERASSAHSEFPG
jgi:hypothetical protein